MVFFDVELEGVICEDFDGVSFLIDGYSLMVEQLWQLLYEGQEFMVCGGEDDIHGWEIKNEE